MRKSRINRNLVTILSTMCILFFSCGNGTTKGDYIEADTLCSTPQCVIVLQPYEDFSKKEVEKLLPKLQNRNSRI